MSRITFLLVLLCVLSFTSFTEAASRLHRFRNPSQNMNPPSTDILRFAQVGGNPPANNKNGNNNNVVVVETQPSFQQDPLSAILNSPLMTWVFVAFIAGLLCLICYCFRSYIPPCVAAIETGCYWFFKILLSPLKFLWWLLRTIFYPIKQLCLATKDRWNRHYYPAESRVSGLRY